MAKGQVRGNKEQKKPKSTDKKLGPKYMRSAELAQPFKTVVTKAGQKK